MCTDNHSIFFNFRRIVAHRVIRVIYKLKFKFPVKKPNGQRVTKNQIFLSMNYFIIAIKFGSNAKTCFIYCSGEARFAEMPTEGILSLYAPAGDMGAEEDAG